MSVSPGRPPAAIALAVIALCLALAPAALAADPDPRCAGWEASTPPPGIDMEVVCPQPPGPTTADANLGTEPAVAWIVALLVVAGVLTVVGVVAMRVSAPPSPRRRRGWWTCPDCESPNAPDRARCFACQAPAAAAAVADPG